MAKKTEQVEVQPEQVEVQPEQVEVQPEQQVIELSIARALNEIKILSKRIDKESSKNSFVTYKKGQSGDIIEKDVEDFAAVANSLKALIERRAIIKTAISVANSSNNISAGGYTMSITAALAMKETALYQEKLLSNFKRNLTNVRSIVEEANEINDDRLQKLLEVSFGKDTKGNIPSIDAITSQFFETNKYEIVDEEIISKNINTYEEMIESFKNDIDFSLSEANATIKIQIPA